jgi:hypothetical protein
MIRTRSVLAMLTLGLATAALTMAAHAQYNPAPEYSQAPPPGYYPPPRPQSPPAFMLGTAHVDGRFDHDNIKVGRYAGRFHSILLKVNVAPIQFDHVVIHYGDGYAETLPVNSFISPGGNSRWIVLPGGRRVIHSLELWYSRGDPRDPNKPEVELYGAP